MGEVGVGLEEGEGVGPGVGVMFPGLGEGATVTVYRVVAAVEAPVAGDCVFGLSGVEDREHKSTNLQWPSSVSVPRPVSIGKVTE